MQTTKKIITSALILTGTVFSNSALAEWKPAEHTMLTPWAEKVTPANAWQEYPRPQLVREGWTNLNGLWDYKVTKRIDPRPKEWGSQILVPFAIETPLSGVGQRLEDDDALWYRRTIVGEKLGDDRSILHFEGVDYACMVWLNGELVGSHKGGLLPFSFDISKHWVEGENEILVRVIDDTDAADRYQLRGKQLRNNHGIWYTPSSGIWQTVWLESVPNTYIDSVKSIADMNGKLAVTTGVGGATDGKELIKLTLLEEGKEIANSQGSSSLTELRYSEAKLWSPDNPKLYDLRIELLDTKGNVLDSVESYVGYRSVGKALDEDGNWRFTLNGEEIFHWGPLDQGWWPGSFLNPPADAAIPFEMNYLKEAGFNMIRKHKKVEPRRYYYHADRIGLLVWQDQTSGGAGPNEWPAWKKLQADNVDYKPRWNDMWKPGDSLDADWPDWAHEQYMEELKIMVDTLYNHPSIVVWTTFNERWGQHRSMEVGEWIQEYDSTRLLNIASGGNFFAIGDIADEHDYPDPTFPLHNSAFDDFVKVVGEFGGHGFPVDGHLWDPDMNNWGYGGMPKTMAEFKERYIRTARLLGELKAQGIAAGVYTQTTDVEGELNGLMTYDRKVMKLDTKELLRIHTESGIVENE